MGCCGNDNKNESKVEIKVDNKSDHQLHAEVQTYYGQTLTSGDDLQTNACCTVENYPKHIKNIMAKIHDEVITKYYGCGLVIPSVLEGAKVLDLGSGAGRDCYILSSLVGENGEVVGVDMTKEQLAVANKYIDFHQKQFGHKKSNVSFVEGYLEDLDKLNLKNNYFDVIISNCVINLVADKKKVLKHAFNLLAPGGEMYFSDVYCSRRLPKHLASDPVLYGECLGGALYMNDFLQIAKEVGFVAPREMDISPITVNNPKLEELLEGYEFFSITYRLMKINSEDHNCEDYGQAVSYKGGLENRNTFVLDRDHVFLKGKVTSVCRNTYKMLSETRFNKFFDFYGSEDIHFGLFEESSHTHDHSHDHAHEEDEGACGTGGCC